MLRSLAGKVRARFEPRRIHSAYRATFGTDQGRFVLAHIADMCHATETTFETDPMAMAVAEGRRQIWLSIQDMMEITELDLREMLRPLAHETERAERGDYE